MPMTVAEILTDTALASARGEFPGVDVERGVCRYRSPDGRKCVVGRLIPDARYVPECDSCGTLGMALERAQLKAEDIVQAADHDSAFRFLAKLQAAHDGLCIKLMPNEPGGAKVIQWDHEIFVSKLEELAAEYRVPWSPPPAASTQPGSLFPG